MIKKIAFFDRDGVLNVDKEYVYRSEDFEWMPGAIDAIRYVTANNWIPIVVTNQSGIARGYYQENDVIVLHRWMNEQLKFHGVEIADFLYCPYLNNAPVIEYARVDHEDRKPNPGMLLKALSRWGASPEHSFIVGDNDSDIEAGRRAGVRGLKYSQGNLLDAIRGFVEI